MFNVKGDLFHQSCDALCITTNGFRKKDGSCVMGRGCAKQLTQFYPEAPKLLGDAIRENGNTTQVFMHGKKAGLPIVAFPVKPVMGTCLPDKSNIVRHMHHKFKPDDRVPGWACVADLSIIEWSAHQLVDLADEHGWTKVVLPRPGCGAGELSWDDVEPVLQHILDDRFYAVTY